MTFPWMLSSRRGRGKGAYQRLMPISNSCPSWTSHFLTALTVKFTSRLNATKEYGGWRVNDSSVMRKERHSFSHSPPTRPSFPPRRRFPQYGGFFSFLHLRHVSVMEGLTCELSVGARELGWQWALTWKGDDWQYFLFFGVVVVGLRTHPQRSGVNQT